MFGHIYTYRLKCLLRSRKILFWTLLYPILLALFFHLALSNLSDGTMAFKSIPVAVVDNSEYRNSASFQQALNACSDNNPASSDKLFHISVVSQEQAAADLDNGKVEGYILFDSGAHVVVKLCDTDQTIIKEFVDSYLQTASAYKSIISKFPEAATSLESSGEKDFISETSPTNAAADSMVIYYYALIAMAAMFGGYWGRHEVEDIQADQSASGARLNLVPVHKMKVFLASFCAAVTIEFGCMLALIAALKFAFGMGLSSQLGYIIAVCFMGSIMGVSFGALIAAVVKGSSHLKSSIMIALSLLLSFCAGMMSASIKYSVTHALPFMAFVNPANLISDALYSLYYYSSHTRFFINIGCLGGLSAIFIFIIYLVLRRRKYASI